MKNIEPSRILIAAPAVVLCLMAFFGAVESANAACEAVEGSSMLFANSFFHLVSNRSRMIQFSVVAVVCGCALLWWRR